jgi:hypothetical protein
MSEEMSEEMSERAGLCRVYYPERYQQGSHLDGTDAGSLRENDGRIENRMSDKMADMFLTLLHIRHLKKRATLNSTAFVSQPCISAFGSVSFHHVAFLAFSP